MTVEHTMTNPNTFAPRLTHAAIVKSPALLPMLYRLSELQAELGVPQRTLEDWLGHGVPHHRDASGHVWVNGRDLAAWIAERRAAAKPPTLAAGQAYCLGCRRAVTPDNPVHRRHRSHTLLQGRCPHCGGAVNRGQRRGQ